jgi:hypothetical protein
MFEIFKDASRTEIVYELISTILFFGTIAFVVWSILVIFN